MGTDDMTLGSQPRENGGIQRTQNSESENQRVSHLLDTTPWKAPCGNYSKPGVLIYKQEMMVPMSKYIPQTSKRLGHNQ